MTKLTGCLFVGFFVALQIINGSCLDVATSGVAVENAQDKAGLLKRGTTNGPTDPATTTTENPLSLPDRIRDSIYNGIRNFGNAVRYVPATLSDLFRNVSRTTSTALRRNTTVVLIVENATSATTTTAP